MKKIISLIIGITVIVLIFSGYINYSKSIQSSVKSKEDNIYPIMYFMEDNIKYNVLYPYLHQLEENTIDDSFITFKQEQKVELNINEKLEKNSVTYEVINPLTKEIIIKNNVKEYTAYDEGTKLSFDMPYLQNTTFYILKLEYNKNNRILNYYQPFYVSNNIKDIILKVNTFHNATFNQNSKVILPYLNISKTNNIGTLEYTNITSEVDKILWDFGYDYIKMNKPNIRIKNINKKKNLFDVEIKYTLAIRKDYNFKYWDYTEKYSVLADNENIDIIDFERIGVANTKIEYNNDSTIKMDINESVSSIHESEDKNFVAFEYNKQLWLYDNETRIATKVFAFDKLDSDYIMDSYKHHDIDIVSIDNDGDMTYIVYGYMNDGKYIANNGILINKFKYSTNTNEDIAFIQLPYDYSTLNYYINKYYSLSLNNKYMYIKIDSSLYKINLKDKKVSEIAKGLHLNNERLYITEDKKALLYNELGKVKKNKTVKMINISGSDYLEKNIQEYNMNTHIIDIYKNQIILASYNIKDTFEQLDGKVIYPYSKITILDSNGNSIRSYSPDTDTYYKDVIVKDTGTIQATNYKIVKNINSNAKLSRVITKDINTLNIDIAEENERVTQLELQTISKYNAAKTSHNTKGRFIKFNNQTNVSYYEVYLNNKMLGKYNTLVEALNNVNRKKESYVLFVFNNKRKIVWTSDRRRDEIMIRGVSIIPQNPELPRGCEVTSVSMLLEYYLNHQIDKLNLAKQIEYDQTPYEIKEGMINFGDMHVGFTGDMADVNKPGLGVYHEPIIKLIEEYMPGRVINLSGTSFEDILYYVATGKPILVINPNIYRKIPESRTEHWVTPNGMMEVSYTEHSVVIVGYDESYVYYNDPSKNILDKKKIDNFKSGWESIGSQAIMID